METRELERIVQQKPVLWVGAGLSVAAGCPSRAAILSALRGAADVDLPDADFATVDAFVSAVSADSAVDPGDVLQRLFQVPHEPAAGQFTALVTTKYDDLLERALAGAGVKVVVAPLEHNVAVREQDGAVRLLKIHGSFTACHEVQLNILLQQHPLLFVGCSLQDPRILQWLAARPETWTAKLKRWRVVMQPSAWTAALGHPWNGSTADATLKRAPLKPITIDRHEDLPALWLEVAKSLAGDRAGLDGRHNFSETLGGGAFAGEVGGE